MCISLLIIYAIAVGSRGCRYSAVAGRFGSITARPLQMFRNVCHRAFRGSRGAKGAKKKMSGGANFTDVMEPGGFVPRRNACV